MAKRIITDNMIKDYCGEMHQNEMSTGTIKKYFLLFEPVQEICRWKADE